MMGWLIARGDGLALCLLGKPAKGKTTGEHLPGQGRILPIAVTDCTILYMALYCTIFRNSAWSKRSCRSLWADCEAPNVLHAALNCLCSRILHGTVQNCSIAPPEASCSAAQQRHDSEVQFSMVRIAKHSVVQYIQHRALPHRLL